MITDLLEAGLLTVGARLEYRRPRSGEIHQATVTASGKLVLEDGQEFATPSGAARAAADSGAVDGWGVWTVAPGKFLGSLRRQLLEEAAKGASDSQENLSPAGWNIQRRYEWLNQARLQADTGNPLELLVRDLFVRWGETADGGPTVYQRIEADLANHGLATSPNFRKVSLDTAVRLVIPAQEEPGVDALITATDDEADWMWD